MERRTVQTSDEAQSVIRLTLAFFIFSILFFTGIVTFTTTITLAFATAIHGEFLQFSELIWSLEKMWLPIVALSLALSIYTTAVSFRHAVEGDSGGDN